MKFFDQKLQLTYSQAYVQATEEAFSHKKEHPALKNIKFLWVSFALLDSYPDPLKPYRHQFCRHNYRYVMYGTLKLQPGEYILKTKKSQVTFKASQ